MIGEEERGRGVTCVIGEEGREGSHVCDWGRGEGGESRV